MTKQQEKTLTEFIARFRLAKKMLLEIKGSVTTNDGEEIFVSLCEIVVEQEKRIQQIEHLLGGK